MAAHHFQDIGHQDLILPDRGYPAFWLFQLILQKDAQFCARVPIHLWKVARRFSASGMKEKIVKIYPNYFSEKAFWNEEIKFPRRSYNGPNKGVLEWCRLTYGQAQQILKTPRYAQSILLWAAAKTKTLELIVEEGTWETNSLKIPGNKLVYIQIDYKETYLRKLVKEAGGRWDGEKKVWEIPCKEVIQLGLKNRMTNVRN